jgi:hypothetical protein
MKYATFIPVILLIGLLVSAQTKKADKTPSKKAEPTARVWHRHVSKDEIDGDRIAFYLQSVEDELVLLIVVCPDSRVGFASLKFPFALYGATQSTLKYKAGTGETREFVLGMTDGHDALVAPGADVLKPLVGSVFRVQDASANFRTYHLPAAGTAPFDGECKSENP